MLFSNVVPDISIGLGFGSVSVAGVFLYLYRSERSINKSLVASMMNVLQNNTAAITKLNYALDNKMVCPLSGTDALALFDRLRSKNG